MKFLFLFVAFLFFFSFVYATDENSDSNILDANVQDFNVFQGPITLQIEFEQQLISSGQPLAEGWFFTGSTDYFFSVDLPNLENLYVLDFFDKEAYVYSNFVPDGWHPMVEADVNAVSFRIDNLIGTADPDLFLVWKNALGTSYEHLDVGKTITVIPPMKTKYFLAVDVDKFGDASFSFTVGNFIISAVAEFKKMPDVWQWIERFGMDCSVDPSHKCLLVDGKEFDLTNCLAADSEQNLAIGEGCPVEICINGPNAYRDWREETLQRKLELEQEKRKAAEEKTNPELANQVAGLISAFASFKDAEGLQSQVDLDRYVSVGAAVFIFLAFFGVGFVVNRKALPIQPIVYGVKQSVMKKFEEAKSNGFWKGKEEELHKPAAGGEPVAEAEAGAAGAVGSAAAVGAAGSAGAAPFRWVKRGKGGH